MKYRELGPHLNILQLNTEGISQSKSECLAQLAVENKIDVILVQETHVNSEIELGRRGLINGFKLAGALYHEKYGSATYIRDTILNSKFISSSTSNNIHTIIVDVGGLKILNLYKPPNISWPNPPIELLEKPALYAGDFNSHHTAWGYRTNDDNGEKIFNWSISQNLHLIFDAKDQCSFHSARHNQGYNPDIGFVSEGNLGNPITVKKKVLKKFPRSQHKPILLEIGLRINLIDSIQKPRWNFQKASWTDFSKKLDANIRWISPEVSNYERFIKIVKSTAKKTIPRGYRKEYIPGWTNESTQLYEQYKNNNDNDVADELIHSLDSGRREKWKKTVENMNFTHSSRKAWSVIRKLGTAAFPNKIDPGINPNLIATRIIQLSKVPVENAIKRDLRKKLKRRKNQCRAATEYSHDFSVLEVTDALKSLKSGKAAGFDGMYNEFLLNAGPRTRLWLSKFFSKMLSTGNIPSLFQKSKVIAILKPGKANDCPENFRPISLLSVCYKLLERLIFNRISPTIDATIPPEQAGFRPERDCCDQVMALTTHIEIGFQKKLKTGITLLDLSAAYDTVWKHGLLLKFLDIIPCLTLCKLINSMLSNRELTVFVGEKYSRPRILNNGLPQGSVLAPLLFTLYLHDMPATQSRKFIYADDIAIAFQSTKFKQIEETLTSDSIILNNYFKKWRLRPNPNKTEVSCFHLNNGLANETLNVYFDGTLLNHNPLPKYLGVTLDRSLTYHQHLNNVAAKIKCRINIVQKLAGTSWGADFSTLRTSSLALVYSVAEYCAPVFVNSHHVNVIDTLLNRNMRIISGTVRSTPLRWLPVLSHIAPPEIRRKSFLHREWQKIKNKSPILPIAEECFHIPHKRLPSRKPIYESYSIEDYSIVEEWKNIWNQTPMVYNHQLILDPTKQVTGSNLSRKQWSKLNRLRTGQGRCASCLYLWNFIPSPSCDCGEEEQTMLHITDSCPLRSYEGGIHKINCLDEESALRWLEELNLDL